MKTYKVIFYKEGKQIAAYYDSHKSLADARRVAKAKSDMMEAQRFTINKVEHINPAMMEAKDIIEELHFLRVRTNALLERSKEINNEVK